MQLQLFFLGRLGSFFGHVASIFGKITVFGKKRAYPLARCLQIPGLNYLPPVCPNLRAIGYYHSGIAPIPLYQRTYFKIRHTY